MQVDKKKRRVRRKFSIRNKVKGTVERPRLTIYKSNKNIYVQIIDDEQGLTICSSSTLAKELNLKGKCNKASAEKIGTVVAEKALSKGLKSVVFDRNGYQYHGVVKELADACRKAGLEF